MTKNTTSAIARRKRDEDYIAILADFLSLSGGKWEMPIVSHCPECGIDCEILAQDEFDEHHQFLDDSLVIACEGFWVFQLLMIRRDGASNIPTL